MQRSKPGEFHWVDLSATDIDGQSAFYEALLGWERKDMAFGAGQTYRWFYKDGHSVAAASQLAAERLAGGAPTMWNTYIAVEDVDATVAKAAELGATVAMPPSDVPGDNGRIAAIQDPTGGFAFFWKPARLDETMTYWEPGTLAWNDLNTTQPEKAAEFYSALVGWSVQAASEGPVPYWQVTVDGQGEGGIMGMPASETGAPMSFWMPYFGSADITADVARASELGGAVHVEPTQVANATGTISFAVLTDPAGATFGLMQVMGGPSA